MRVTIKGVDCEGLYDNINVDFERSGEDVRIDACTKGAFTITVQQLVDIAAIMSTKSDIQVDG